MASGDEEDGRDELKMNIVVQVGSELECYKLHINNGERQ
jgi:hypothetical protein